MLPTVWAFQPLLTGIFVMLGIVMLNRLLLQSVISYTINRHQRIDYTVGLLNFVCVLYFSALAIYFQYLGHRTNSIELLANFRILVMVYTIIYLGRRGGLIVVAVNALSRFVFFGWTPGTWEEWIVSTLLYAATAFVLTNAERTRAGQMWVFLWLDIIGGAFWLIAYFLPLHRFGHLTALEALTEFLSFVIFNWLLGYALRVLDSETTRLSTMTYAATYDHLTGLRNFGVFEQDYQRLYKEYQQQERPLTMIALDIDWFKALNDAHGHLAGNKVLTTLGQILSQETITYPTARSYRVGGEEFNILLPGVYLEDAAKLAKTIQQHIAYTDVQVDDITVNVTISVGVAQLRETDESASDFYERTDRMLYQSKGQGRNKITIDD